MVAELALDGTSSIMNVTVEQWAQAEAERQRQSEMVQTLINEVRRLGTEQKNILQEIQRVRAEQLLPVPPVEPSEGGRYTTTGNSCRTRNHRHEKSVVFSGDESTWEDWSFKLCFYVLVVDF